MPRADASVSATAPAHAAGWLQWAIPLFLTALAYAGAGLSTLPLAIAPSFSPLYPAAGSRSRASWSTAGMLGGVARRAAVQGVLRARRARRIDTIVLPFMIVAAATFQAAPERRSCAASCAAP
jgi:hypothetical protein